jgi:hypothetical protein
MVDMKQAMFEQGDPAHNAVMLKRKEEIRCRMVIEGMLRWGKQAPDIDAQRRSPLRAPT